MKFPCQVIPVFPEQERPTVGLFENALNHIWALPSRPNVRVRRDGDQWTVTCCRRVTRHKGWHDAIEAAWGHVAMETHPGSTHEPHAGSYADGTLQGRENGAQRIKGDA